MRNYRQLEVFRAVMHAGGFSPAARRLKTSQPTVSRTIAEFERSIGYLLFSRKGTNVFPTPEAIELFKAVDRSFLGAEAILREAAMIGGSKANNFRILANPSLAHTFIPHVVARFLAKRPSLKISIDVQRSEAIAGWSSIEGFDVGFSMLPIHRHGLETSLFDEAQAVCILREDHPLAQKDTIDPRDLDGVAVVAVGPLAFGSWHQTLNKIMADAGANLCIRVETPISAIASELVLQGVGVAIVDHFVAYSFRRHGLIAKAFNSKITHQYGVFTPTTTIPNALTKAFINEAEHVRNEWRGYT